MGFFEYLGDTLSGKNYKRNTLVVPNVDRIAKKVENRPQPDFVQQWVYSCVISINTLLNNLLFESIKEEGGNDSIILEDGSKKPLNPFNENIEKLDEQRVFEIFKLLSGHYLAIFPQNEKNFSLLQKLEFGTTEFENEIFTIFDFTRADEATYRKLLGKFKKNPAGYFLTLYKEIFDKAFGMPNENNLAACMIFSEMLSSSYIDFMQFLNQQIEETQR
jgi:hypothetical protein